MALNILEGSPKRDPEYEFKASTLISLANNQDAEVRLAALRLLHPSMSRRAAEFLVNILNNRTERDDVTQVALANIKFAVKENHKANIKPDGYLIDVISAVKKLEDSTFRMEALEIHAYLGSKLALQKLIDERGPLDGTIEWANFGDLRNIDAAHFDSYLISSFRKKPKLTESEKKFADAAFSKKPGPVFQELQGKRISSLCSYFLKKPEFYRVVLHENELEVLLDSGEPELAERALIGAARHNIISNRLYERIEGLSASNLSLLAIQSIHHIREQAIRPSGQPGLSQPHLSIFLNVFEVFSAKSRTSFLPVFDPIS